MSSQEVESSAEEFSDDDDDHHAAYTMFVTHTAIVYAEACETYDDMEHFDGSWSVKSSWDTNPEPACEVVTDWSPTIRDTCFPNVGYDRNPLMEVAPNECHPHPLDNHVILENVFKMLRLEDLKICRLVNRRWNFVATPKMLHKGVISLDAEDTVKLNDLRFWMRNLHHVNMLESSEINSMEESCDRDVHQKAELKFFHFQNFVCDNVTHYSYANMKQVLGNHVQSFTVSHCWNDSRDLFLEDYENLLLHVCPNLKELSIPATHTFSEPSSSFVWRYPGDRKSEHLAPRNFLNLEVLSVTGDVRPAKEFWNIVLLSPKLKSLKLDCDVPDEFWAPEGEFAQRIWKERMANIKIFEVKTYGIINRNSSLSFTAQNWENLKRLELECYEEEASLKQVCTHHVADVIEELRVVLFNEKYQAWPIDRGSDWIISKNMKHLKHLELQIDDHCEGPIFCRTLVATIFLDNLVSVKMGLYNEEDWNENDWPSGLFTRILVDTISTKEHNGSSETDEIIRMPRKLNLRILSLPPKFQDVPCTQYLRWIYPNVKELELQTPTPDVVSEILTNWIGLERFKVSLWDDSRTRWSEILLGIRRHETPGGTFFVKTKSSLVNLQKLTSLELTLAPEVNKPIIPLHYPLTDYLINYGLLQMPGLQNIVVQGHQFSSSAIANLEGQGLKFCHIKLLN